MADDPRRSSWDIKKLYITQIKGDPCIYNKHMIFPEPGVDLSDPDSFASIGMTVTGLPALNAIASVVAARPGLITSPDLPLRGFARSGAKNRARRSPAHWQFPESELEHEQYRSGSFW